ncbi:HTH_Tnp_Tc3_2 domain-containing protein [Trichonephila clavipes]|nr:HTH_Tnp_Tc3_2 domain-containing protein [Trichonephila clavipes]
MSTSPKKELRLLQVDIATQGIAEFNREIKKRFSRQHGVAKHVKLLEVYEELEIAQSVIFWLWQRFQDDGNLPVRQFHTRQFVYRRLGHIGIYARRPVRCVPRFTTHFRLRLTWSSEHALWTPQQWAFLMFSDDSRFSLQSDSRRTLIWRAPGTRCYQENTIQRYRYGGAGWLVWE